MQLEQAVAEPIWDALYCVDLFDRKIFLAGPGVDLREVNGKDYAIERIFRNRQKLACVPSFAQRFFFPTKASIDNTQEA
jgi:hypothetical protein